jgi:hypothetical protein
LRPAALTPNRVVAKKLFVTPAMASAPRADGIEIVWAVSRLACGRVEFRSPGGLVVTAEADDFGFVPQSATVMRVRLDGLSPGATGGHPSFLGRVAFQTLREQQAAWLRRTVTRPEIANAPHRIVFCHIPLRWIDETDRVDYAAGGYDRYARSSRELWHDSLVEWGAQVVISGHTHRPASIPASEAFPYAQMIGGGPRSEQACWIEGRAAADGLTIAIRRTISGATIHREWFQKLA